MIVSENRFKKIFKKIVVLMLCFAFVLSCFAIPKFECATLEDNIYFEFKDDPFAPSIEAVNGTNTISFYTGANFDIACSAIIIDLNNGTIHYRVLGGSTVNNILAFNHGSWVDNSYAKIIQTKTFNSGETSQIISDVLYTWLYDAANVLTLYEFVENNTFNFLISPFNSIPLNTEVGNIYIYDSTGSNSIFYNDSYYNKINFEFRGRTLYGIYFLTYDNEYVDVYRNYTWLGSRNFYFTIPSNIEIGDEDFDVEKNEFYLWFIQQLQRKPESIYSSIGGYYNKIDNARYNFDDNVSFQVSGTYDNLPFNQIVFIDENLYVRMVSSEGEIISSTIVNVTTSTKTLYFNYQSVSIELYNSLNDNGVFTSTPPSTGNGNTFTQFIQLVYTFIDIPLYYLRNILDISILSVSLQSICYTLLSVGILIWLIKQVVGLNSIGGK